MSDTATFFQTRFGLTWAEAEAAAKKGAYIWRKGLDGEYVAFEDGRFVEYAFQSGCLHPVEFTPSEEDLNAYNWEAL